MSPALLHAVLPPAPLAFFSRHISFFTPHCHPLSLPHSETSPAHSITACLSATLRYKSALIMLGKSSKSLIVLIIIIYLSLKVTHANESSPVPLARIFNGLTGLASQRQHLTQSFLMGLRPPRSASLNLGPLVPCGTIHNLG